MVTVVDIHLEEWDTELGSVASLNAPLVHLLVADTEGIPLNSSLIDGPFMTQGRLNWRVCHLVPYAITYRTYQEAEFQVMTNDIVIIIRRNLKYFLKY